MIRILIADDHKLFREVLIPMINDQADMTVVGEAGSGREAVKLCKRLRPDLVLLDFGLPHGNGLETMHAILADRPKTNVVFLTVFAESQLLIEAIRDGAKGYIIKDTTKHQLFSFIRGVVRGELAISPHMIRRLSDEMVSLSPPDPPD